jgi:uncharacterized membrane protein (UPF0127 family)
VRDESLVRTLVKMYRNTGRVSYRRGSMRTVVFETREQQQLGLQHFSSIPDDTVFKFPRIPAGTVFHSRNVPEPFEIVFVSAGGAILKKALLTPPLDTIEAPPGTSTVYEARPGVLRGL